MRRQAEHHFAYDEGGIQRRTNREGQIEARRRRGVIVPGMPVAMPRMIMPGMFVPVIVIVLLRRDGKVRHLTCYSTAHSRQGVFS